MYEKGKKKSSIHRWFLRTVLAFHLRELRRQTNRKLDVLESMVETFETERARAVKNGAANFVQIHDCSLFIVLLSYDLTVLTMDRQIEFRDSRKNFYSRQLCLLISEALEDLPDVLGKKFRVAVNGLTQDPKYLANIGQCTKQLSALQKTYGSELREIRSFVSAHRDHDPNQQLVVIRKMDDKKIDAAAKALDLALNEIVKAMTPIAQLMGDMRVILQNMKLPE